MSDPQQLPQEKARARARAQGGGQPNLPDAPGLRNLAFLATGLTVAAVVLAVPALRDQAPAAVPPLGVATPAVTAAQASPAQVTGSPAPTAIHDAAQAAPPSVRVPVQPPIAPPPAPIPLAPARPAPAQAAAAAAAPPQAQPQPIPQPASCTLNPSALAFPFTEGVVIGLEDPAISLARIRANELKSGGKIDPNYANTLRAKVQQSGGSASGSLALPPGMVVHVGDRVTIMSGSRNMSLPCNYTPPHLTGDLGPAKPPAPVVGTPPKP